MDQMYKFIVKDFIFHVSREEFLQTVRIVDDPDDEDCRKAAEMLGEALICARPKYVYCLAAINAREEDTVIVEGRRIESSLVRKNLDKVNRIIPFVATCGVEAESWSRQYTDLLERFWADEIKKLILVKCCENMLNTVKEKFFPVQDMSQMNPGSLAQWPITEQAVLFDLIGDVKGDIGVTLTDSFLMVPAKSVSGFFFSSETHYENCQLCPMKNCPGRRTASLLKT
jgi:hypothetical protein